MKKTRHKSKSRGRQRKSLQSHKRSVLGICAVLMLMGAVISVGSINLQAKNREYIAQEQELVAQIEEEKNRAAEIEELEQYVGTDEYVEQVAKDKLGLVYENEIIFKSK